MTLLLVFYVILKLQNNNYHKQICAKPLIKDPPRKGQPLYKGHSQYLQKCICICTHFQLLKKTRKNNSLSTRDKMAVPKVSITQRFLPLYVTIITIPSGLSLVKAMMYSNNFDIVHNCTEQLKDSDNDTRKRVSAHPSKED